MMKQIFKNIYTVAHFSGSVYRRYAISWGFGTVTVNIFLILTLVIIFGINLLLLV